MVSWGCRARLKAVVSLGVIRGRSMQPTLNPDGNASRQDIVLLDRRLHSRHLERGDVVVLRCEDGPV